MYFLPKHKINSLLREEFKSVELLSRDYRKFRIGGRPGIRLDVFSKLRIIISNIEGFEWILSF